MIASVWDAGAMRPAGVARRAAALVIDALLLGWLLAWLALPLGGVSPWLALALTGPYAVLGEGWRGRTVGKKAMGLFVLSASGGGRLGYRRALARWAARAAPVVPALLAWTLAPRAAAIAIGAVAAGAVLADHGWALRQRLGRTLHDLAAGAVVLRQPRPKLFDRGEHEPGPRERRRGDS